VTVWSEAERAVRGEPASSVEGVIERETAGLLAYFTRRVSPVEDAADLLAETLLVLWRRADAIPPDQTAARMWTYGVARRVLATHRREATRRSALADRLRQELATQPHHTDDDNGELLERLHTAMARLPDLDREIIRLVHWDGFSLVEVAGVLRRRKGTIRSRYHRARKSLKRELESASER
jgi:RNA polymerase sigma-70 factor, ECF subfamily